MKTIFSFIVIFFSFYSFVVSAQGECTLGLDEITINPGGVNAQAWVTTGNQIFGRQVTAEKSGMVVAIGIVTGRTLTFKPAIYSDENNSPNNLLWSSGSVVGPTVPLGGIDTAYASVTPFPVNFGDLLWPAVKWSGTASRCLLHLPSAEGLSFQFGNSFVNAFPPDLTGTITQSGIYGIFLVIEDCVDPVGGCMDSNACNFNPQAQVNDESCEYVSCLGCTNPTACNYSFTATIDDSSCIFAETFYDCLGVCLNDSDNDGVCDELEISGCTDLNACNYNEEATEDDGSCIFSQVGGGGIVSDFNGDSVVNNTDFMFFLTEYGNEGGYASCLTSPCDLDSNGNVGFGDLAIFIGQFGMVE